MKYIFLIPILALGLMVPAAAFAIPYTVDIPAGKITPHGCAWTAEKLVACLFEYGMTLQEFRTIVQNYIPPAQGEPDSTTTVTVAPNLIKKYSMMTPPSPEPETKPEVTTPKKPAKQSQFVDPKHQIIEDLKNCLYGIGEYNPIQQDSAFEIPEERIHFDNIPLKTNVKLRELVTAYEACRIMEPYAPYMLPQYRNIVVDSLFDPVKVLDETDDPRTDPVTERDIQDAKDRAQRTIEQASYLQSKTFTGINRGGYTDGAECQQRPIQIAETRFGNHYVSGGGIMCPIKEHRSYATGLVSLEPVDYEKIACEIAWKTSNFGNTSPIWWREMIKDGTCDEFIPEIVEKRDAAKYQYKLWKHQNAVNCPDCREFQQQEEKQ